MHRLFFWLIAFCFSLPVHAQLRIIGGSTVTQPEFPWAVLISLAKDSRPFYCEGTLIAPEWILTAAHCTYDENTKIIYRASELMVSIAENNLTVTAITQTPRKISSIILHPQHNFDDYIPYADMALLKLETPITTITPVRLADTYTSLDEAGVMATVLGWGQPTQHSSPNYSEILKKADVPIVSLNICNEPRSYNGTLDDTLLCAGYAQGGADACLGDSGGGLVVNTATGWQQIALVSFGQGCGLANYYGVYTRTTTYLSFIQSHICTQSVIAPTIHVTYADGIATAYWDAVENVDGYYLYFAPYSNPMNDQTLNHIASIALGQQRYFITALQPNDAYYVAVSAYRGNCTSVFSNIETTHNF
ncbi:S1 family peptidase [Beggiatoa leptomitoformis]|uniref:Trypsin-like serine protease n=1 Tax=Beggiatoa leptomitoformis TaxID=288004 RepID=A0A2N9YBS7_9GAMM|nr:serine protease [Beggiatoa leptomitoformis]AUI67923.1 trypsin-like serine protease [Beggiatoa leptomitoformis]QGX03489.1 trypsin-like serine protease [Beggiatoa leptomitoformis]